jgi:hypothetical protein
MTATGGPMISKLPLAAPCLSRIPDFWLVNTSDSADFIIFSPWEILEKLVALDFFLLLFEQEPNTILCLSH